MDTRINQHVQGKKYKVALILNGTVEGEFFVY